ncbi:MAG: EAL domain-containing protein, partial [Burkholderiales bacterium]
MLDIMTGDGSSLFDPVRFQGDGLSSEARIRKVLNIVRTHLDMDVGFVSEFVDGQRVFRHVDGDQAPLSVGDGNPLEDSYCQRVVDGRLPELMADACENAEALTIGATRELPVGAHMSVPLFLPDGRMFGTFCCFSFLSNPSLNARDLRILRAFAAIVADLIHEELHAQNELKLKRQRIEKVIAEASFHVRYQPIYRLNNETVSAFECLARFEAEPYRSPDQWFAEAEEVGLAEELEVALARKGLEALAALPKDVLLSVNFSP